MPGFRIERREGGRISVRLIGCCGNLEAWQREYDEALREQRLERAGAEVSPAAVRAGAGARTATGQQAPSA